MKLKFDDIKVGQYFKREYDGDYLTVYQKINVLEEYPLVNCICVKGMPTSCFPQAASYDLRDLYGGEEPLFVICDSDGKE